MLVTAALAALGGVIAWLTIRSDLFAERERRAAGEGEPPPAPVRARAARIQYAHCAVGGPPLRTNPSQVRSDGAGAEPGATAGRAQRAAPTRST